MGKLVFLFFVCFPMTLRAQEVAGSPSLVISNDPVADFGRGASEKTLTVANAGSASAVQMSGGGLGSPFSFKGSSYPGLGGTCGASLAPGATCTLVLSFNPPRAGYYGSTLVIRYSDGASSAQWVMRDVQGEGL